MRKPTNAHLQRSRPQAGRSVTPEPSSCATADVRDLADLRGSEVDSESLRRKIGNGDIGVDRNHEFIPPAVRGEKHLAIRIAEGDPAAGQVKRPTEDLAPIWRDRLLADKQSNEHFDLGPVELPVERIDVLRMSHQRDNAMLICRNGYVGIHFRNLASRIAIGNDHDSPVERSPNSGGNEGLHSKGPYRPALALG